MDALSDRLHGEVVRMVEEAIYDGWIGLVERGSGADERGEYLEYRECTDPGYSRQPFQLDRRGIPLQPIDFGEFQEGRTIEAVFSTQQRDEPLPHATLWFWCVKDVNAGGTLSIREVQLSRSDPGIEDSWY